MLLLDIKIVLPKSAKFKMSWLADCGLLSKIFASQIIPLESNDHHQRRLVNMRGQQFTEEIIHLSDNKFVYQIVGNRPVKDHQGQIEYICTADERYLHYKIQGQSNTWVPTWLLRIVMFYDFTLAARRLRKLLSES